MRAKERIKASNSNSNTSQLDEGCPELLKREQPIAIQVGYPHEILHIFIAHVFHQLPHYFFELVTGDKPVLVFVENSERLFQLVLVRSSSGAQVCNHHFEKLLKFQAAIPVSVVQLHEFGHLVLRGPHSQRKHDFLDLVELEGSVVVEVEGLESFLQLVKLLRRQTHCHFYSKLTLI